ncbi:restriction endonuclease [Trichlorobacter lovleyi]|uniref:restriction endonuclease n=1 Tax=Trichlorobacter lovleyi TaxID=313985 RepID=UPI00223F962A|nr:restriction endonuclease [Trichlorobacter lovleyi]QOX77506.1 restriction endonuclease [Trichlorobacter lovleyi]
MPRQKTSPFEELVLVTSRLPWWVGIVLALVSYAVLHQLAGRPLTSATVGEMVVKGMLASLAMLAQYILPFGFGLAALISGINALRQKRLYEKAAAAADATALNQMSWGDFEQLVAEHFQRAGFQVSRAGGNGPDGGIDLVVRKNSEKHLVQCKQWKAYKVGVQPVREFYGVMAANGATGGYFVTSGVYTDEAIKFAQGLNLELIDGPQLKSLIDRVRLSPAPSVNQQEIKALAPACPKCGGQMKKRLARQGSNAGKEFWGCAVFPKCNGIRSLEECANQSRY